MRPRANHRNKEEGEVMIFCNHKWRILGKKEWFDSSFNMDWPKTTYHQECKKCGKLKNETINFHVSGAKHD